MEQIINKMLSSTRINPLVNVGIVIMLPLEKIKMGNPRVQTVSYNSNSEESKMIHMDFAHGFGIQIVPLKSGGSFYNCKPPFLA